MTAIDSRIVKAECDAIRGCGVIDRVPIGAMWLDRDGLIVVHVGYLEFMLAHHGDYGKLLTEYLWQHRN